MAKFKKIYKEKDKEDMLDGSLNLKKRQHSQMHINGEEDDNEPSNLKRKENENSTFE